MGWADCGIARELRPRLKSRLPGMMLSSPRRAKSDKHLDEGNPVGSDFRFRNVWAPEIWGKEFVYSSMHFRAMERKVKATGSPKPPRVALG